MITKMNTLCEICQAWTFRERQKNPEVMNNVKEYVLCRFKNVTTTITNHNTCLSKCALCRFSAAAAVTSVVSDSVRPHRRQPTRLPLPWDSPGKNTGVGCHFLLQCMKVKSESEVAQLYPTSSDPMNSSLPGSSTHGIFQARVLEWVAIVFSQSVQFRSVAQSCRTFATP